MVTLIGSVHKTTRPRPRPHPSIGDAGGGSNVEIPSVDLMPSQRDRHVTHGAQGAAPRRLRSRPRRWATFPPRSVAWRRARPHQHCLLAHHRAGATPEGVTPPTRPSKEAWAAGQVSLPTPRSPNGGAGAVARQSLRYVRRETCARARPPRSPSGRNAVRRAGSLSTHPGVVSVGRVLPFLKCVARGDLPSPQSGPPCMRGGRLAEFGRGSPLAPGGAGRRPSSAIVHRSRSSGQIVSRGRRALRTAMGCTAERMKRCSSERSGVQYPRLRSSLL